MTKIKEKRNVWFVDTIEVEGMTKLREEIEKELPWFGWRWDESVCKGWKDESRVEDAVNLFRSWALKTFKDYWFYAGEWHNAGCAFIRSDRGVCCCNHKKILKKIGVGGK